MQFQKIENRIVNYENSKNVSLVYLFLNKVSINYYKNSKSKVYHWYCLKFSFNQIIINCQI